MTILDQTNTSVASTTQTGEAREKPAKVAVAKTIQPKAIANRRQPIVEGETRKRTLDVSSDNKKVRATFTFAMSKGSTEYPIESVFDFSNCTQAEILQLAASSVRITIQGKLRKMGDKALDMSTYTNIDVKAEVIEVQRTQVDDLVKTIRQLAKHAKMSEADARKFIEAQLAKNVKAK